MHTFNFLAAGLSIFSLGQALPVSQQAKDACNALIETSPWHISDIVVFNALPTAPRGSYVHFHILDTNSGLEIETFCGVSMPVSTGLRPEEATGWHPCEDGRVRFLYQPGNLQIRRSYLDDCLGEVPWNGGAFYGNTNTQFQVTASGNGETWSQTTMEMPATSQT